MISNKQFCGEYFGTNIPWLVPERTALTLIGKVIALVSKYDKLPGSIPGTDNNVKLFFPHHFTWFPAIICPIFKR